MQAPRLADKKKSKSFKCRGRLVKRIEAIHRAQELGLPAIARMTDLDELRAMRDSDGTLGGVISDRDQPPWPKEPNQLRQQFLTGAPLLLIVSSIREWGVGFVGVKRKHIPQEDARFDLRKYTPDHGCCPFGHCLTFCGPRGPNAPAGSMRIQVNVVRQS
jgi:hypothetical protein